MQSSRGSGGGSNRRWARNALNRLAVLTACCCVTAVALSRALALEPEPSTFDDTQGALATYVARADPSFGWRQVSTGHIGDVEYVELILTSQTWREIPWKHQLFVLLPSHLSSESRQGLLFIHGGRWRAEYENERSSQPTLPREARLFAQLAETLHSPVGVLRQVPFQPLFERREDALIAYTFDRYLDTGESDWPLLLPMVKSAVRGMDAMQVVARERWSVPIETFTVCGASKRGWTSWLTAAVDPRVAAVAPMVIDVLNMVAQIDHQKATWGDLSEEIRDYADFEIPARLRSDPRGSELLSIVDPYAYRSRLTQPKLILLATNDRYWPLDALRLYWADLPEPKHVLYFPNQGHDFRDFGRLIGSLSALHRYTARGETLPTATWKFTQEPRRLLLSVQSVRAPQHVRVWSAHSSTRDFRSARWTSQSCRRTRPGYACSAALDSADYTAAFAELSYKDRGEAEFSTSTTVCIAPPTANAAPMDC
jgi:PhoPQ-activated pathogenicity-related protein